MKTLVIDTATPACSVALFDSASCVAGEYQELGRGHAERLVPMIQTLPGNGQADQIYVNVGPGSFTGIRVGISAARALGLAWGAPCLGYSCLSLVAAMAQTDGIIDAAMQAGHGEFFFQSFDEAGQAKTKLQSLKPKEAAAQSKAAVIAGSAANAVAELRGDGTAKHLLPDARQWLLLSAMPALEPKAIYGRQADAKPSGQSG
ncbi:MAG: tRNA (adenosine(37)-N6)-threonylcarbamoyltransferase complex dimerization subunit type 1 TsaB [Sphingorhabdus sp.]